jgi:predicted DNA-binding transcriptional regulator YafY
MILLRQDKVTAPYLAEKFEVSRRTINRDIEDICKAGIPVVTTQGVHGGISVAEGFKIDKNLLKQEELEAILIGLKSLASVTGEGAMEQLLDKLSVKDNVVSKGDNIIIDLASHYKSSLSEKIELLKKAIKDKRLVSFLYFNSNGESRRVMEPYYITFKWCSWYVFGYCRDREDFRLFKLNRMADLSFGNETFSLRELPPERKELNQYFQENYPVKIIFDSCVKYRLVDEYGLESFKILDDGRLLFDNYFTDKEYMVSWLFSFTDKAEIIEPVWLKDEIVAYAENIIKKYKT